MRYLPSISSGFARRSLLVGITSALLGGMSACSKPAPMRISGHPWPGYEPLFFAETQKQLPDSVRLQHLPTIKESIDALREGRTEAAMLTLDEVIALQSQGIDLRVVLVMDVSKGADALVVRKEIQTLTQLRGKRIGLEPSTLGELMLSMILDRAGLKRSEVKPVLIDYERQEAAYAANSIDALITYEPVVGRLISKGANKLISTRDLPESIFDVLAVRADVTNRSDDALAAAIRGHFWALEQLRRNPWDTAYRMVSHAGVSAEELMDSFRGLELPDLVANRRYLSQDNGGMKKIVAKLSAIMMASGAIKSPADADKLFSDAYLPRSRD
jgi:NitT/TauT family transport system substrate-binding protein